MRRKVNTSFIFVLLTGILALTHFLVIGATVTEISDDFVNLDNWAIVSGTINLNNGRLRIQPEGVVHHNDDVQMNFNVLYEVKAEWWSFQSTVDQHALAQLMGTGSDTGEYINVGLVATNPPQYRKANVVMQISNGFSSSGNDEEVMLCDGRGRPIVLEGFNPGAPLTGVLRWQYDITGNKITAFRILTDEITKQTIGTIDTAESLRGKVLKPQFSANTEYNIQWDEFLVRATANPEIALSISGIEFNRSMPGWTTTRTLEITNNGGADLTIESVSIINNSSDAFRALSFSSSTISVFGGDVPVVTMLLQFAPSLQAQPGDNLTATLKIISDTGGVPGTETLVPLSGKVVDSAIKVCTTFLGHRPGDPKRAFVTGAVTSTGFKVKDLSDITRYSGDLSGPVWSSAAENMVWTADFSDLNATGTYYVETDQDNVQSEKFDIRNNIFHDLWRMSMRLFVFSRCGTALSNCGVSPLIEHPPCHTNEGQYQVVNGDLLNVNRDITGGWHGDGSYNRNILTNSTAVARLLWLEELLPGQFNDGELLQDSESGELTNNIPDLHDNIRWGLNWLLKMQNPGGEIIQGTGQWPEKLGQPFVPPHEDPITRYIGGPYSLATFRAGACFAMASRLFSNSDPAYAAEMMDAALRAWDYLENNPSPVPGFDDMDNFVLQYPVVIDYAFKHDDSGDRLWFAVEMYRATGEEKYHTYFKNHVDDLLVTWGTYMPPYLTTADGIGQSQHNMRVPNYHFPMFSYCLTESAGVDIALKTAIKADIKTFADELMTYPDESGFEILLKPYDRAYPAQSEWYRVHTTGCSVWYGMELILAGKSMKNESYINTALNNLHWIFGRNPLDQIYMSGVGDHQVNYPKYRLWPEDTVAVDGLYMLVKGPTRHPKGIEKWGDHPPLESWGDTHDFFGSEPDMEPVAAFAFCAGYFAKEHERAVTAAQNWNLY